MPGTAGLLDEDKITQNNRVKKINAVIDLLCALHEKQNCLNVISRYCNIILHPVVQKQKEEWNYLNQYELI